VVDLAFEFVDVDRGNGNACIIIPTCTVMHISESTAFLKLKTLTLLGNIYRASSGEMHYCDAPECD
jgi:hypothetical protein